MLDFSAADVHHAGRGDIFIGNVEFCSVGADRELLGIRAGGDFPQELSLGQVNHANSIGGVVGVLVVIVVVFALGKNRVALGVEGRRAGNGTSAQGNIEKFSIGAGMNTARSFADGNGGDDLVVCAIDDGDIARFFVAHTNEEGARNTLCGVSTWQW